jgi:hypothetical protein
MGAGRTIVWVTVIASGLLAGCQTTQREQAGPPPNDERIRMITASYRQADPNVRLAVVTATLPDAKLAAATSDSAADFKDDAVVLFIDANEHTIAHGNVVRVVEDSVHIKYEPESLETGGRAPREGDVAVHILEK